MYTVILNFETGKVDVIDVSGRPTDLDDEEFIEDILGYSLSNCQWMTVVGYPEFNNIY